MRTSYPSNPEHIDRNRGSPSDAGGNRQLSLVNNEVDEVVKLHLFRVDGQVVGFSGAPNNVTL